MNKQPRYSQFLRFPSVHECQVGRECPRKCTTYSIAIQQCFSTSRITAYKITRMTIETLSIFNDISLKKQKKQKDDNLLDIIFIKLMIIYLNNYRLLNRDLNPLNNYCNNRIIVTTNKQKTHTMSCRDYGNKICQRCVNFDSLL